MKRFIWYKSLVMVDKANVELLLLLIKESANIYPPNIKVIHTLSLYEIIGEVWMISIIIIQQCSRFHFGWARAYIEDLNFEYFYSFPFTVLKPTYKDERHCLFKWSLNSKKALSAFLFLWTFQIWLQFTS